MQHVSRVTLSLLLSGLTISSFGCSQRDLGRYCFVGAESENSNSGDVSIINVEAPECIDRLCMKQGGYRCTGASNNCASQPTEQAKITPMCTQQCETNEDCDKTDENINGCKQFVCQRQDEKLFEGCACVCLDFIRKDTGEPVTASEFNSMPNYNRCE